MPVPAALAPILDDYLSRVRPELPGSAYVFANPHSFPGRGYDGRYNPRSVHDLVIAAGRGAGVAGPHFPHRWRHTYATSLIRRGVDVSKVQRLLGHSRLATTERYVHLVIEDLAAAVDEAFPDTTPQPPASPSEAVAPVLRLVRGDADSA